MKNQQDHLQYRYPGVTPFTTGQSHIFFGREEDTTRLVKLIRRHPLTVLHGKSGLGKSSLINAGVIPVILEEKQYSPLVIRFGAWTNTSEASPIDITKDALKHKHDSETFLNRLIPEDDSLWFQAKTRQLNGGGKPLLLFDQFEELFSYPNTAIEEFQREIAELLHTGIPLRFRRMLEAAENLSEEEEDQLEAPLEARIVFAIRSDRLHLLGRLKDYLPNILRYTYELKALTVEDARNAIILPAQMEGDFHSPPFQYSEAALTKLLDFLKEEEQSADGLPKEQKQRIEGILIQMLCEHFERNQVEKSGLTHLGINQIGDPNSVVINYYDEKINALLPGNRLPARRLIEDGLVSEGEGMRLSLHEAFILQEYRVEKELLEKLVDNRLLRSEPFLRGGYTYELSHDRLVPAVMDARARRREAEAEKERQAEALRLKQQAEQERKEKEKAKRQLRIVRGLLVFAVLALIAASVGVIYANIQKKAAEASEERVRNLLTTVQEKDSLNDVERYNRFLAEAQSFQREGLYALAIPRYELAKEYAEDTIAINEAIALCKEFSENQDRFQELLSEANQFIEARNYSKALDNFQEAVELGISSTDLRLNLEELKSFLQDEANKAASNARVLSYDDVQASKYKAQEQRFNQYVLRINSLLKKVDVIEDIGI